MYGQIKSCDYPQHEPTNASMRKFKRKQIVSKQLDSIAPYELRSEETTARQIKKKMTTKERIAK